MPLKWIVKAKLIQKLDSTLVEAEEMRIRVQVMPFENIDWKFQLSYDGFRNFPAKPLDSPMFRLYYPRYANILGVLLLNIFTPETDF